MTRPHTTPIASPGVGPAPAAAARVGRAVDRILTPLAIGGALAILLTAVVR